MLISSAPPSQPPSVSYCCLNETVAAGAVIGIDGDVRSVPPPTVVGSRANTAFGPASGVVVVVTKLVPPETGAAVQPAGMAGALTPSKFSLKVTTDCPTTIVLVKFVAPRLLFTFSVSVIVLPHAAPAGTV